MVAVLVGLHPLLGVGATDFHAAVVRDDGGVADMDALDGRDARAGGGYPHRSRGDFVVEAHDAAVAGARTGLKRRPVAVNVGLDAPGSDDFSIVEVLAEIDGVERSCRWEGKSLCDCVAVRHGGNICGAEYVGCVVDLEVVAKLLEPCDIRRRDYAVLVRRDAPVQHTAATNRLEIVLDHLLERLRHIAGVPEPFALRLRSGTAHRRIALRRSKEIAAVIDPASGCRHIAEFVACPAYRIAAAAAKDYGVGVAGIEVFADRVELVVGLCVRRQTAALVCAAVVAGIAESAVEPHLGDGAVVVYDMLDLAVEICLVLAVVVAPVRVVAIPRRQVDAEIYAFCIAGVTQLLNKVVVLE